MTPRAYDPPPYPLAGRGKVRDVHDLGDRLLLLASDRLSAFDVVLTEPIPGKGATLTRISRAGQRLVAGRQAVHLVEPQDEALEGVLPGRADLRERATLVRKTRPLPVECVVRGHLAGSAWKSYRRDGTVQGVRLPAGLREAARLPDPIFTPTTKAAAGHDEPLDEAQARALLGDRVYQDVQDASLALFAAGSSWGAAAGLLLADTKFEFGVAPDGRLLLIDEAFTPDSSRWWDAATWREGATPAGFDKQFVRDHLAGCGWNYQPPPPALPPEVIRGTIGRYAEAERRLLAAAASLAPGLARARVQVREADITTLPVDVLVNAANTTLLGGGGVDGAVHRAAGPGLQAECARLGGCPVGGARITGGHALPARHVVHVVGPVWRGGGENEAALLASCHVEALRLAASVGATTVAFPAVSTGAFGYPAEQAAQVAVGAVVGFLQRSAWPREVVFATWGEGMRATYSGALR